jgi:type II secretory pathway pseudopilin PulG
MRKALTLRRFRTRQRGYIMITLMLTIALIAIALLAVLPEIKQQIKRDREEEMVHRGTAYMRAIQHFYKKFGRYPARIEELENTNNIRFLRKRYKDPLNHDAAGKEKDFKFLTQTDITLNNGPVLGTTPGQGGLPGQGGIQGGLAGVPGGLQPGGIQTTVNSSSQAGSTGAPGTSSSGAPASGDSADGGDNPNSAGAPNQASSPGSAGAPGSGSGFNGPTFGGGPIVGVSSLSKEKSIRVFYDKNHYNDWLFIYLPQADLGGLLKGPVTQNGPTMGGLGGLPGQPGGLPGQPGGLPGQGIGLNPNGGQSQTPAPPTQSPSQSQPQ